VDFVSSRRVQYHEARVNEVKGSCYYVAPEVLTGGYTNKCDVWSIGVILYILICGRPPFDGLTESEILSYIAKGEYSMDSEIWDDVSQEVKELVHLMLEKDPQKRISANDALQHPWFKIVNQDEDVTKKQVKNALSNLRNFHSGNKMRQATMGFIINHFMTQ
jgi:calcium-dependent protein kinase